MARVKITAKPIDTSEEDISDVQASLSELMARDKPEPTLKFGSLKLFGGVGDWEIFGADCDRETSAQPGLKVAVGRAETQKKKAAGANLDSVGAVIIDLHRAPGTKRLINLVDEDSDEETPRASPKVPPKVLAVVTPGVSAEMSLKAATEDPVPSTLQGEDVELEGEKVLPTPVRATSFAALGVGEEGVAAQREEGASARFNELDIANLMTGLVGLIGGPSGAKEDAGVGTSARASGPSTEAEYFSFEDNERVLENLCETVEKDATKISSLQREMKELKSEAVRKDELIEKLVEEAEMDRKVMEVAIRDMKAQGDLIYEKYRKALAAFGAESFPIPEDPEGGGGCQAY
ncbi:hypothetical protein C2845_PM05G36230 [Panicum miliaceum]|uniref:Uncharacterized protein n=1 Tax=Panicum miliaceum TaxID=4540 RepID=A0A3L6T3G4_PANMI|nr:hypothetical protein C2845_PM05G36230 [Panicum miliaceum]